MACYPTSASGINYISYPVGPTATSLQLTSGAANGKGSYSEFVASSPFTCTHIQVTIGNSTATTGRQFLLDIATGAAASEVVRIPDIAADNPSGSSNSVIGGLYDLPLAITSGTRIAARCQCSAATQTLGVAITIWVAGDCDGPTTYVNYGANAADSGGQSVDPGGSANTKGAYAQITASTSAVTQILMMAHTYAGNTGGTTVTWLFDIATGAAASEVVLIDDLLLRTADQAAGEIKMWPPARTFITYIDASTRLAVRASSTSTDATDRLTDVVIIAGTAPAEAGGGSGGGSFAFC